MLWIRDLESTNGTYVNRNRIKHAELLEPDDDISIEKYKFKVKRFRASTATTPDETIHSTLAKEISDLSYFEPKLQMLIRDRKVVPHFQPVARFSDMIAVGYEILGRVDDEELPSNPSELLDMAACLGLASDLSSLFREVGVEIGKHVPGSPLLFVNTTQLEICEIDSLLTSLQRMREIAPLSRIVLEVNEKAAADTDEFPQLRDALGEMDIGLAFDDFGVGQTRLVDLSTISPDYLKFDISLIRQIHLAPKRLHQMISTFINASHDLGILTLAEGIECAEEAEVCDRLGFDLGQGFFFGRPEPIDVAEINLNFTPGARS
jgi:EAL domain-containing protein (putative c-di-GMP-specific phosphodiesterase class I)